MKRSIEALSCIFAILKLGAVWLPLDPDFPEERLVHIIEDSGVGTILSTTVDNKLSAQDDRVVFVDSIDTREFISHPPIKVLPDQRAYVIYTSGSTGKPKGVELSHANAINFFAGMDKSLLDLPGEKVWLALTTISFDISILELIWTLTRGYKVVIGSQDLEMLSSDSLNDKEFKKGGGFNFSLFYLVAAKIQTTNTRPCSQAPNMPTKTAFIVFGLQNDTLVSSVETTRIPPLQELLSRQLRKTFISVLEVA